MVAIHHMHLHGEPFRLIKSGSKTIEIRLNDEKRQLLKVGDEIILESRESSGEAIRVRVIALEYHKTFKDAFYAYLPTAYGATSQDDYIDMYQYYSKDDEVAQGAVAIRVLVVAS